MSLQKRLFALIVLPITLLTLAGTWLATSYTSAVPSPAGYKYWIPVGFSFLCIATLLSTVTAIRTAVVNARDLRSVVDHFIANEYPELLDRIPTNKGDEGLEALRIRIDALTNMLDERRQTSHREHLDLKAKAAFLSETIIRLTRYASMLESGFNETVAATDRLMESVERSAGSSKEVSVLALSATEVANAGGHVVKELVGTMDSISQSSRKIVDIIRVIDSIAFQTNILALNASVEAARAGEQGRGFAVVANEVQVLARRSAVAAKEIQELINASVSQVSAGTVSAEKAGHTMYEIVTQVTRVSEIMNALDIATQTEAQWLEKIIDTVHQLNKTASDSHNEVSQLANSCTLLTNQLSNVSS